MFEGNITAAVHAPLGAPATFADEELLAFTWGDLVARLAAAQELRVALAYVPVAARASFDAMTAEHLANRRCFADYSGKHGVNPELSGNGKVAGGIDGMSADSAIPADRGIA